MSDCEHCAYRGCVEWKGQSLLICVNCADGPGRMKCVEPGGLCPNFCALREPPLRPTPPPNGAVCYIALTKGLSAMVDAQDYERLRRHKWHASGNPNPYARRAEKGVCTYMHREIMQPPEGLVVDHIDGNRLNNLRSNLRVCTPQQNLFSRKCFHPTSRFRGVHWNKVARKWEAGITHNRKPIYLGLFDDEMVAARTYDFKAMELFGEFARLNFPEWSRLEDGRWRQRIREPARLMRLAMIRRGLVAAGPSAG